MNERLQDIARCLTGAAIAKTDSPWIKINKNIRHPYALLRLHGPPDNRAVMVNLDNFENLIDDPMDRVIDYVYLKSNFYVYQSACVDATYDNDLETKILVRSSSSRLAVSASTRSWFCTQHGGSKYEQILILNIFIVYL